MNFFSTPKQKLAFLCRQAFWQRKIDVIWNLWVPFDFNRMELFLRFLRFGSTENLKEVVFGLILVLVAPLILNKVSIQKLWLYSHFILELRFTSDIEKKRKQVLYPNSIQVFRKLIDCDTHIIWAIWYGHMIWPISNDNS